MPQYTYNGVTVTATRRRPSSRDDKKYERTVTIDGTDYLVHYGDPNMEMQRDNPDRRANFLSRHSCDTKRDPKSPGFWACLDWQRTDEKSVDMENDNDLLLTFGGEIKALGDGKVGGYLVRFTDADNTDLEGDYFTKSTDFGIETGDRLPVYYNHGLDATLKRRRIGRGTVEMQDVGVWVQAQLDMRDEYEEAIYRLVESGKVGWSSGSMPHLVEREPQKGAQYIKSWPLGEASITPTPAAGAELTRVQPLKSWQEHAVTLDLKAVGDTATETATATADSGQTINVNITVNTERESVEEETKVSEEAKVQEQPEVKAAAPAMDVDAIVKAVTGALAGKLEDVAQTVKAVQERVTKIEETPVPAPVQTPEVKGMGKAPAVIGGLGDTEAKAWAAFYKRGDVGGIKHLQVDEGQYQIKASNDTDMNIGTAADGGNAVPTGHYNGIITKMDEIALYQRLGVEVIPGEGTTVNVPLDNEADGEFVSTAETTAFDRDAPAIGTVAMTLVKYTKKIEMSYELMQDETSQLMAYVNRRVGFGLAKTHNQLLVTEILANGTAGLTFDAAAAIGAAEVPELMYKLKGEYADSAVWLADRGTEGYLRGLTGNNFQFVPTPMGSITGSQATGASRELFGRPIFNTAKMPDIGAGNKSLVFGNFAYVGMRLAPDMTVLRDPYSKAVKGQVLFHYYFRTVYKVLIAEAIQYATHPTA